MSSLAKITSHIELLSRINTKRSRIDYLMGNNILTIIYDYLMGNNSDMVMVSWMSGSGGFLDTPAILLFIEAVSFNVHEYRYRSI